MQLEEGRLLALNGTRNLRDLGGYPTADGRRTRWRTLYRSDCLDRLDEAGQQHLIEVGVRTIIDLRDDNEVTANPNVFASSQHITYKRMPFWDEPPPPGLEIDFSLGYRREVSLRGERLRTIFQAVVAPGALPVLIHCAAGKDRTGVVVGMLLDAVGVSRETIAQDYALSSQCLGDVYTESTRAWLTSRGLDPEKWAPVLETPPERMLRTLEYVDDEFGGIAAYLIKHGLDPNDLHRLNELITNDNYNEDSDRS